MSVSVKGVLIDDMKAFLARKKQERDQRGKIVRRPDKNQTSKPKNPEEKSKPKEKGEIEKARGSELGMGMRPSSVGKLGMMKKWDTMKNPQ